MIDFIYGLFELFGKYENTIQWVVIAILVIVNLLNWDNKNNIGR